MSRRIIKYTDEELLFMENNCSLPRREAHQLFCEKFNREDVRLDNYTSKCKINGWLTGRTGCFKQGHMPHPNARPKGPNKTSFKKGDKPANYMPVGTERFKEGYWQIKVAEGINQWKLKHRVLWEERYGTIPKNRVLLFKDSNSQNLDLDNLELINRKELVELSRNNFKQVPIELKPTVRALVKLQIKMNDRINKQ